MTWTEPATWYASLPAFHAAAAAWITDPDANVLLVKPTYRDHWAFPGGYVEEGEYPHQACAREVQEELGVVLRVDALLVVDWAPAAGQRPRSLVSFTFDCGKVANLDGLIVAEQEIEDVAFFEVREAERRLPGNVAPRVRAAIGAQAQRSPAYLADGRPYPLHVPRDDSAR